MDDDVLLFQTKCKVLVQSSFLLSSETLNVQEINRILEERNQHEAKWCWNLLVLPSLYIKRRSHRNFSFVNKFRQIFDILLKYFTGPCNTMVQIIVLKFLLLGCLRSFWKKFILMSAPPWWRRITLVSTSKSVSFEQIWVWTFFGNFVSFFVRFG